MRSSSSLPERISGPAGMLGIFVCVAIFANAFAINFVTRENFVYFWDTAIYWHKYIDFGAALSNDFAEALRALLDSIKNDDYNLLPALPLVPFSWLFGPGRLAYIIAVTNVALVPSVLVLALLARRISRLDSAKAAFSSLVLAATSVLLIHAMWVPVLRGYPDVIGVLTIGIILLLHFEKPLAEQGMARLVTTGLLLCLLVLLRRYYAFWVVAFFPAVIVAQCLGIYQENNRGWKLYATIFRNAVIIGLTFTSALFMLATPLMLRIWQTDYADIYSAYKFSNSMLDAARQLQRYFGWPVLVCGLSGLGWLTVRKESRIAGAFLITQLLTVFVLFTRTQDFGQQHYYLLIPGLALGIAVAVIALWTRTETRIYRMAPVIVLLITLLASFTVFFPGALRASQVLGVLVPKVKSYPLVRNDVNELNRMLDGLERVELEQRGDIYVLASSDILNSSILQNACRQGSPQRVACDHILSTNDVDKRDGFPQQFLRAQYLVVASPTQYHLRAEDQRVIGILSREVLEAHGIGISYKRLPDEFKLDNKVTASVLVKIKPFERTDLDALATEFAGFYPDMRVME